MSAPELRPSPLLPTPDLAGQTVLVLHAHPDDEAIFTGLTLRRLADAGARTVLVVATDGDLGGSRVPLRRGETVGQRRRAELEEVVAMLGGDARVLLRAGEPVDDVLDALVADPSRIERPVVIRGGRAVVARPPERALDLL